MIAEAVARAPPGKYEPGITSEEWQMRRYKARRIANYKVSHDHSSGRQYECMTDKTQRVRELRVGRFGKARWRRRTRMGRLFEGDDMYLRPFTHLYSMFKWLQASALGVRPCFIVQVRAERYGSTYRVVRRSTTSELLHVLSTWREPWTSRTPLEHSPPLIDHQRLLARLDLVPLNPLRFPIVVE